MNNAPVDNHLDDSTIAAIAEGGDVRPEIVEHLAVCDDCRRRTSAVSHLLADFTVASEIDMLDRSAPRSSRRWLRASFGTIAAAAAILIVVVATKDEFAEPARLGNTPPIHRDGAAPTSVAPEIVSGPSMKAGQKMEWTSIPEADLYRVRIWNTDGVVVYSTETRDTTLLLPSGLESGKTYLWEVKARTGWDRWISSDFVQISVDAPTR